MSYDLQSFLSGPFDCMSPTDFHNSFFIRDLLPDKFYSIDFNEVGLDLSSVLEQSLEVFQMYDDKDIINKVKSVSESCNYHYEGIFPFHFRTNFLLKQSIVDTIITCPEIMDSSSYVFLGHEFHHVIKEFYPNERKLRDTLAEVIPMFYELLSSDVAEEKIKKEILASRMALLILDDKSFDSICSERALQYFNSFYYATCLYYCYKREPTKVLKYVSNVLKGKINTKDLLVLLDLYDNGMDSIVENEVKQFKEFIKNP